MKTLLLCSVVLMGASLCFGADAVGKAVEDAERAWAKAVSAKDYAALDAMLADTLIYAHSTGNVESKQVYLEKMKGGTQRYDSIVHESIKVAPYGSTAVAHSMVRMKGTAAEGPFDNHLMMMHVWVKQGPKWRLVAHQTTRLPK